MIYREYYKTAFYWPIDCDGNVYIGQLHQRIVAERIYAGCVSACHLVWHRIRDNHLAWRHNLRQQHQHRLTWLHPYHNLTRWERQSDRNSHQHHVTDLLQYNPCQDVHILLRDSLYDIRIMIFRGEYVVDSLHRPT